MHCNFPLPSLRSKINNKKMLSYFSSDIQSKETLLEVFFHSKQEDSEDYAINY